MSHARILLLSRSVPPLISGSSTVVKTLARHFGADELIVAGERQRGDVGAAWPANGPRLVYIASGLPLSWRGARWWRRLQVPLMLWRTVRLVRQQRCNTLIAVFPIEEFLLVAYLAAVITGATLIPYFHNTFSENRTGLSGCFARWLQARVFARAAHVFVISDGLLELFRARYPHLKCSTLPHMCEAAVPEFTPPAAPGETLRLAFCGSVSESCRDALSRVCEVIRQTPRAELSIFTPTPGSYLRNAGLLGAHIRCDCAPEGGLLPALRQADVVVLPHGLTGGWSADEYRTIFPTRTIDYLLCGRPILAHTPPDCYLTRFLQEHACALVVTDPDQDELLRAIERLRTDPVLRAQLVRNALQAARLFHAPRVMAEFRARLSQLVPPLVESSPAGTRSVPPTQVKFPQ
jgi:glycosyltransferase involved in cell wall biosynthesis